MIAANQHFIILASDGIWDQITASEAVKFIESHKFNEPAACSALVTEAAHRWLRRRNGLSDDVTAVIIYLNGSSNNPGDSSTILPPALNANTSSPSSNSPNAASGGAVSANTPLLTATTT